jgi:hypothetical protein
MIRSPPVNSPASVRTVSDAHGLVPPCTRKPPAIAPGRSENLSGLGALTRSTSIDTRHAPPASKRTAPGPSMTPGGLVNSARAAPSYRTFVSSHVLGAPEGALGSNVMAGLYPPRLSEENHPQTGAPRLIFNVDPAGRTRFMARRWCRAAGTPAPAAYRAFASKAWSQAFSPRWLTLRVDQATGWKSRTACLAEGGVGGPPRSGELYRAGRARRG